MVYLYNDATLHDYSIVYVYNDVRTMPYIYDYSKVYAYYDVRFPGRG